MLIDKRIMFSPDDGGSDPTNDDSTDDKEADKKDDEKKSAEWETFRDGVNDRLEKLSNSVFASSRKDNKTEKELDALKKTVSDLTGLIEEHVIPKPPTAKDKLKQMTGKDDEDGKDSPSLSELVDQIQKATSEDFDKLTERFGNTISEKLAEIDNKYAEKEKVTKWIKRLEKEGIPEDYVDLIPVDDEDALTKVKNLIDVSDGKSDDDDKKPKKKPGKKVIDVKEPHPVGGDDDDEHTRGTEMMEKMRKLLKEGDLKGFSELLDEAVDKGVEIDNDEISKLHVKALEATEEKKRKKRGEGSVLFS